MEQKDINNSLSAKIFCAVMEEIAQKYSGQTSGAEIPAETAAPAASAKPLKPEIAYEEEPRKQSKGGLYAIIAVIAVLIVGAGIYFATRGASGENNPLGVQKPNWEKFVRITSDDALLYEMPDAKSHNLVIFWDRIKETEKIVMRDKDDLAGIPRNNVQRPYDVDTKTVFPVLDESEEWYKVYIGVGDIREAYVMKSMTEEIMPEPITAEMVDSIWAPSGYDTRVIAEGEFANLVLNHVVNNFTSTEQVEVGVLTGGCVVMPHTALFYPKKDDVAVTVMNNTSADDENKSWDLSTPATYWKDADDFGGFDINKLTDSDLRQIVTNLRPSENVVSRVWYYFPSLGTDGYKYFDYSFSPKATAKDEEGGDVVTGYKVENDRLLAEVNGEYVDTQFSNLVDIEVKCTTDLDQDGSMECLILGHPEGDMLLFGYMVVFNPETGEFSSYDIEYIGEPKEEDADGGKVLVMRRGIRSITYGIEDYAAKKLSDEKKDVGTVLLTFGIDDLIGSERKDVDSDIDGDGASDQISFASFEAPNGDYVIVESIYFGNGKTINTSIEAQEIKILKEKTLDMPDIIGDDYLYRWNGSSYEPLTWDGKQFVKHEF